MFTKIRQFFGLKTTMDTQLLLTQGAQLIDVRSPHEFQEGHHPLSINIPLDELEKRIIELDPKQIHLTVCRSGMRSNVATKILVKKGFEAYNAGPWSRL